MSDEMEIERDTDVNNNDDDDDENAIVVDDDEPTPLDDDADTQQQPSVNVPVHQIRREYKVWRAAVPFLYDLVLYQGLIWPSTTVSWLPWSSATPQDTSGPTIQHCLVGSNTSASDQPYLQVMEITLPPKYEFDVRDDISNAHSLVTSTAGKIKPIRAYYSATDIRRVRIMPKLPTLAACKCDSSPTVDLFDVSQAGVPIPTRLTPPASAPYRSSRILALSGHSDDGWGLSWSPHTKGHLISGAHDSLICHWDVNAPADASSSSVPPLRTYAKHTGPVMDVHWNHRNASLFASGSDDRSALLWDVRTPGHDDLPRLLHDHHVNSLEWNPFNEHQLAAGTMNGTVSVWDARQTKAPERVLQSGQGPHDVTRVAWAPFQDGILAASGNNRRVVIWDLARVGLEQTKEEAAEGPPELAFIHGGHTSSVTEFDWCSDSPWTIASVSDNNILEIWEIAETLRTAPTPTSTRSESS